MMKMSPKAALLTFAAVSLTAAGCATQPQPAAGDVKMVKIFKTGSNMPVMVPYMGAEHVRYIEATSANREQMDRTVSPPIPLNSN